MVTELSSAEGAGREQLRKLQALKDEVGKVVGQSVTRLNYLHFNRYEAHFCFTLEQLRSLLTSTSYVRTLYIFHLKVGELSAAIMAAAACCVVLCHLSLLSAHSADWFAPRAGRSAD